MRTRGFSASPGPPPAGPYRPCGSAPRGPETALTPGGTGHHNAAAAPHFPAPVTCLPRAGQGWLRASESHPAGASLLLRPHSPPALALPHSEVRALMNTPSRSHRIPGRPTRLAVLAVAVVLLAAGCSAFGGDDGSGGSDGAGGAGG